MKIDVVCSLESFRRFMILSTCSSFIPDELLEDDNVFPERPIENGTMYVEAEDKGVLLGANIDTLSKAAVGAATVLAGVHAVRRMKGE